MGIAHCFPTVITCLLSLPYSTAIRAQPLRRSLVDSGHSIKTTISTFDPVVVGDGNANLVLAARLSENSLHRMTVVEASGCYGDAIGNGSHLPIPAKPVLWVGKEYK